MKNTSKNNTENSLNSHLDNGIKTLDQLYFNNLRQDSMNITTKPCPSDTLYDENMYGLRNSSDKILFLSYNYSVKGDSLNYAHS